MIRITQDLHREAEKVFKRAVQTNPGDVAALTSYASLLQVCVPKKISTKMRMNRPIILAGGGGTTWRLASRHTKSSELFYA